jgi:hypothetical protein
MTWWPAVVLALVLVGVSGCGRYEEIARFPSPDDRVDAVVVEVDAGAGNPFVYRLYLVPRGGAWRKGDERLSYADPVRFRVAWADARHLELCYDDARFLPVPERRAPTSAQAPEDLVEVKQVKPAASCTAAAPPPRS